MAQQPVRNIQRLLAAASRCLDTIVSGGLILVLPLSLLLFLQWPLREVIQAYSREANDLAQILFALYVSLAISYATRQKSHLAVDALAYRYAPAIRAKLNRIGALCALLPWSVFIMFAGWPLVSESIMELERFSDTFNPGYFLIKGSAWLLALLVSLQAVVDICLETPPEQA